MIHGDSQCFSRLYAIKKHWLAVLWATQHFREMNHGKAMVCVYGLIAFQSFETQKSFFSMDYPLGRDSSLPHSKRSDLSGLFSYLHKSNAFLDLIRDGLK
ncbi:hypothetical protein CYV18_08960 [Vibrio vulnificus]|nr:hypothetical protein CYV18_08960 [Vibrio vulnificus]